MTARNITTSTSFRILHKAQDLELSAVDKSKQAMVELVRAL